MRSQQFKVSPPPAKEYICTSDRRDSTGHRLTKPLHACSVRQSGRRVYCRQSGERLGESHLCKTMAGAVPSITNIYSLGRMFSLKDIYSLMTNSYLYIILRRSWKGPTEDDLGCLSLYVYRYLLSALLYCNPCPRSLVASTSSSCFCGSTLSG